jgi:hypothetical protein
MHHIVVVLYWKGFPNNLIDRLRKSGHLINLIYFRVTEFLNSNLKESRDISFLKNGFLKKHSFKFQKFLSQKSHNFMMYLIRSIHVKNTVTVHVRFLIRQVDIFSRSVFNFGIIVYCASRD